MRLLSQDEKEKIASMYLGVVKYYVVRFEELFDIEENGNFLVKRAVESLLRGLADFSPDVCESLDRFIRGTILKGTMAAALESIPDWKERSLRAREAFEKFKTLKEELGRWPEEEEFSQALGVGQDDAVKNLAAAVVFLFEEGSDFVQVNVPVPMRTREEIAGRIESLPADVQLVISLHHFEEFSFEEISRVIGCSRRKAIFLYASGVLSLFLTD